MAEVHDCWDTRLGRAVAVKLLHPALGARPDARARFEEEARAAARLSHPNIVAVHDYGHHGGTPYIVMERLPGSTLLDEIARGPLPPMRVRTILDEVLAALSVAHAAGVVHRDIKPANILTSGPAGGVKVADFGIAKTGDAGHTATGQMVGTMAYTSPQRLAGAPSSVADDLYAVGVVGYELVAGRPPFPQNDVQALAFAILNGQHAPLTSVVGVDPALADVIERAIAHDPGVRFTSADQMRAALAGPRPSTRVFTAPFAPVVSSAYPARPARSWTRRRTILTTIGVVVALVVAVLAAALQPTSQNAPATTSTSSTPPPPPPPSSSVAPQPIPSTTVEPVEPPKPQGPPPGRGNDKDKGPKNRN